LHSLTVNGQVLAMGQTLTLHVVVIGSWSGLHGRYAVIGCKLKQNANGGCNSCATVLQVLQDMFYVLLHVLFYL